MQSPRPFVHVRIAGDPLPAKRRAAVLKPTRPLPQLLAMAHRARSMPDLLQLFNATTAKRESREHKAWRKALEDRITKAVREQLGPRPIVPKGEPLQVMILAVQALPISRFLKRSLRPRAFDARQPSGDFDNIAKPVCDAANGILWHDDCQVARAVVEQLIGAQGEPPRLELIAMPFGDDALNTMFERVLAWLTSGHGEDPLHGEPTWPPTSDHSLPLQLMTSRRQP